MDRKTREYVRRMGVEHDMSRTKNVEADRKSLLEMTSNIVSAYASRNNLTTDDLTGLMESVYETLAKVNGGGTKNGSSPVAEPRKPAVPVRDSITDEYLVCLEDGAKLKMLKRHLRTHYDLTPEQYRAKWNLPLDYPMVAPGYAKRRSKFAKSMGLGKTNGKPVKKNNRKSPKKGHSA